MNTRLLATKVLVEVLHEKHSLNEVLPEWKAKCKNVGDASLVQAICFGVLRWYPRLNFIMNQLLQKPLPAKEYAISYLICVGLYQLIFMRIPDHAAISETVAVTRLLRKPWATGLVNAVLRHYQREKDTIEQNIQNLEKNVEEQDVFYAHPEWLIQAFQKAWPYDWKAILNANNEHPPLIIRVNTTHITEEDYMDLLQQQHIKSSSIPHINSGLVLEHTQDVKSLPGFKEGYFSVQDGASQLVAPLLRLSPGLRVLDACSAPGGKAAHILECEPNVSELVALEVDSERTKLIQENLNRLRLKATVLTRDATQSNTWWDGKLFDRILIDAPCSATGIIRRHPDIKYLRQLNDIKLLAEQQSKLLRTLWPLLKPEGFLLYTTCSIMPEENTHVLEAFCKECEEAEVQPFTLPFGLPQTIGYQILPGQNGCDGFYYALLRKNAHP